MKLRKISYVPPSFRDGDGRGWGDVFPRRFFFGGLFLGDDRGWLLKNKEKYKKI